MTIIVLPSAMPDTGIAIARATIDGGLPDDPRRPATLSRDPAIDTPTGHAPLQGVFA